MAVTEIRPIANRQELDECYDLWGRVFPDGREFFQVRLDYDSSYHMETTWAAYVEGHLAAAIQIFPYETEIGGVRLKVGGIGSVATDDAFRRRGLAQTILRAQTRWMEERGYDLSLLFTGINAFYNQVGWRTREGARFELGAPHVTVERNSAVQTSTHPGSVILTSGDERSEVRNSSALASETTRQDVIFRSFQMGDLPELMQIYSDWQPSHPGAFVRNEAYWRDSLKWLTEETIVAVTKDQLVAYIRVRQKGSRLEIREFCYRDKAQHAVLPLYSHVLEQYGTVQTLSAELPGDHPLYEHLAKLTGTLVSDTGEMWKVIDPPKLMRKLQPVFTQRAKALYGDETHTLLQVEDADLGLAVHRGEVTLVDPMSHRIKYHHVIRLNAADLMQWLLYGAPQEEDLHPVFTNLFPPQSGMLWHTDHF